MNNIDLYTKYSITNKYWNLSIQPKVDYVSLGDLIRGLYIPRYNLGSNVGLHPYGNNKLIPFDVTFECGKLEDKIDNYYYRNIIPPCLFTNDDYKNLSTYNTDPWDRTFPFYMTGAVSKTYVDNIHRSYLSYSYVMFYQERLIRSGPLKVDLMSGKAPLAIMHVTSLEGEPIVCLDIIH